MVCRQSIWSRRDRPNGKLSRHLDSEMLHRRIGERSLYLVGAKEGPFKNQGANGANAGSKFKK